MFLTAKEVCDFTSFKRSSLYKYVKEGHFPPGVSLGVGRVAWLRSEVEAWGQAVKSGLSVEARRGFVAELVAQRKAVTKCA